MINSVYGYPPDDGAASALQELGRLNAENTRLRQEIFDAAERYSDLNDCRRMTEIELKHAMKKDAEKSEKELSIRARDIASLTRDHANEIANLKKQMLLQQQQIQQQQRNQQRSNSEKSTADSKSDSTGRHSSENLVVRESYLIGGTSKAPFNPQNQNQNQSQSQSLSCGSNKSISLQSSHSAITKNTDCNVNKSALLNDTNNSDSSAISEKESPAVKESPRSVDLISKNQTSQTSNSASTVYPAGNPSASLTVLSSAAAAAALNAQVTALPPNPKVSATASGGPSVATKSMIGANTANNIDCDDSLTVINILLPLYKDLMMSAALVSISKSYYFHRTRHSRQSSNVKIEGEEVYRTLAESVSDVDDAFSILARRTQPPVKAILGAADASSSSSPRPGRTVDLICAVCSLARHMLRPALKVSEKSGLSVKEGCNGLHAPDGRSDHCIQSGGIADASRMDMLLRCLTFLTTAIDCLESSDVADVRRAKRVAALVRVGTRSHSSTSSVPAAPSAVTKREPGHESQVDLNDKFEKVAESVCDSDLPLSKRNRIDTPEGRTLKKTKTIGLELTPRPHDHTRPIPMSTIFKELGPSGPRGITSSSRSHSSVKSYVSFTEHGHTTPIVGVRARGNSVDSDTAPPSVASTTDNWSTARRQHRLRGAVESAGDGAYRRATPFPLSALLMPGIDQSVLTATYNSLALLSNPEGPDRGPSPVKPSLEPVPSELPSSDFQVALLPGDLVSLLVDLAALSIALSVPVSYSAQSPRRHAVSSPQGIATFPASPPAPAEQRIELLRKIVDLAQTVFRGDGLLDSLCSHLDMQPLLVRRGTALSSSSPLAGLFVLHFPPLSPSATHRDPIVCDDEESSDELQLLERETLGGRKVRLTLEQKQQLTLESALLSTLLELLKSKTAFKSFMATQLAQNSSGTRSRNRLINMLCRRLILEVSEGDGEFKDYEDLEGESVEFGKPFNMLNIKLQVVTFLTGIVETHGLDGVAALFGVTEILFPPSLSSHEDETEGDFDRKGFVKEGESALLSDAPSSSSSSRSKTVGEGDRETTSKITSSALHCLCLCWMMATRALNQYPRSLPSKGLLMVQLAESVGMLLDNMARLMTPQQWSYLVSLGGGADAQMINRQMSLEGLHPVLLRHCKDNPLFYL